MARFTATGNNFVALCALFYTTHLVSSCVIQGQDSGICLPAQDIQDRMPFCGPAVQYTACVPVDTPWFPNLTIEAKDKWIQQTYTHFIAEREAIEDESYFPDDPTMYNYYFNSVVTRFTNNEDCANAYKNYFCFLNFPRCAATQQSLVLCRSVCENFFKACRYPKDMWRCYAPEYYGGEYAEGTQGDQLVDERGRAIFLRSMFPGLPFRANQYLDSRETEPMEVCTPSLKNGASKQAPDLAVIFISVVAVLTLVTSLYG